MRNVNTTDQTDIQPTLKRIVELAQKATVECRGCFAIGCPRWAGDNWTPSNEPMGVNCGGTGRIQNPKLAPLLDVLVKEIPTPKVISTLYGYDCIACGRGCKTIFVKHAPDCGKPILRSWDGLPEGALAGALTVALRIILKGMAVEDYTKTGSAMTIAGLLEAERAWGNVVWDKESPDQAALQAVLRWLEEYVKEKAPLI